MKKIKVDSSIGMLSLIKAIKAASADPDIELFFTDQNDIYKNASNLQILKKVAEESGKTLYFQVENKLHEEFVDAVSQETLSYTNEPFESMSSKSGVKGIIKSFKALFSGRDKKSEETLNTISSVVSESEKIDNVIALDTNHKSKKRRTRFKMITLFVIGIASVIGIVVLGYINLPKAKVTLSMDSKGLVKLLSVKTDASLTEPNLTEGIIPVSTIQVSETDSMTVPTTGKKEKGEKAKGEVTVYNKTSSEKTIKKGTKFTLISSKKENYEYVAIEEVKVSAKKEITDATDPTKPPTVEYGNKSIEIEAVNFGNEYNLDANEKFKVSDNDIDELVAENDKKLTGGTLEEVKVVAEKDISDLEKLLEESLTTKVKDSLSKKTVNGQELNEASIASSVVKKKFENELGDEVENLSLSMTIDATGYAYKKEDLDKVVQDLATKSIPEQYDWDGESFNYEVAVVKDVNATNPNGVLNLQVKLTVYIIPKINKSKIAEDLSGMKTMEAEKYLSELSNIKEYSIDFSNMPMFFVRMPLKPDRIEVVLIN